MSTWKRPYTFENLLEIMAKLRSPEGCPWDKEQTHDSLLPYLREETAELQDAIKKRDWPNVEEELGDVLLQIVFHTQLAQERNCFSMNNVIDGLSHKLVTRHPHVFGNEEVEDALGVEKRWEEIKKSEKANQSEEVNSLLDGIPLSLSALDRADKIGKRCRKVGFEWSSPKDVLLKIREELDEVEVELEKGARVELKEELGDLFFTLAQLSRQLGFSSEEIVDEANQKFYRRFVAMEKMKSDLKSLSPAEWEILWERAKRETKGPQNNSSEDQ